METLMILLIIFNITYAFLVIAIDTIMDDNAPRTTPTIGAVGYGCVHGGAYTITIEKVTDGPISIDKCIYELWDENGTMVDGVKGTVRSILRNVGDDNRTSIRFHDSDEDRNVSAGDCFHFRTADHGGVTQRGYHLVLRYGHQGKTMNGGGTKIG